jgi:PIN domain nuclease of toxin-antitoxin system
MIYLDTHVAAWLYAGETGLLPASIRTLIENERCLVSPIVELELQFLHEIGRLTVSGSEIVSTLGRELGLTSCTIPFAQVVASALENDWTRDPFDRLIVAQASVRRTPLVTQDTVIHDHYPESIWS